MPAPKRAAKGGKAAGAAKKRSKKAAESEGPEAYEDLFLDDDAEQQQKKGAAAAGGEDEEGEDELELRETAEEKRLRLARAYLQQLHAEVQGEEQEERGFRGVTGGSDDEGDDGEEGSGSEGEDDRVARRLKHDAAEASGRVQRRLAHLIQVPDFDALPLDDDSAAATVAAAAEGVAAEGVAAEGAEARVAALGAGPGAPSSSSAAAAARASLHRGHRLPATAVALASDDSFAVTVSKDGSILKWDLATMAKTRLLRPAEDTKRRKAKATDEDGAATSGPDWVKRNPRQSSRQGLYAVALSSDCKFLAVGGGDKKVHLFDAQAGTFLQSFPGHRDAISALCFRDGTHQLFSASFDRTVKLWSIDDRAYMDSLFGHQAEILSLDVGRAERAVTGGADRSCRIWKVPEESQLVFRSPAMTTDCVRMVSQGEFISGGTEGLQVWNQLRKKPLSSLPDAHGPLARAAHGGASAGCATTLNPATGAEVVADVAGWVQSVAVCRNTDLVASGASDGSVRLWSMDKNKMGSAQGLSCIGGLPVRGCVNGLALSRTGQLVLAAVGQEPRLGRWIRDKGARNGLALFRLPART